MQRVNKILTMFLTIFLDVHILFFVSILMLMNGSIYFDNLYYCPLVTSNLPLNYKNNI